MAKKRGGGTRPGQQRGSKPKNNRGPTKAERVAAQRAARRRRELRTKALLIGGAVVVVGVIIAGVVSANRDTAAVAFPASGCAIDRASDPGRDHVPSPSFSIDPPSGGDHLAQPARSGLHETPPADGGIVHAMEHGFVVLWHRPNPPQDVQSMIDSLRDEFSKELLIVPRDGLGGPIAMTAWHQRLLCADVDQDTLADFVRSKADKGPESGFL